MRTSAHPAQTFAGAGALAIADNRSAQPASPPMALGEFDLIAKYFTRPARRAALGVGDDCALLRPSRGMQLAISATCWSRAATSCPPSRRSGLGHKALAVNLSDLAACGAEPLAFTLALALPRVDETFLDGFSRGLLALAAAHGCELDRRRHDARPAEHLHHRVRRGAARASPAALRRARRRRPVCQRPARRRAAGAGVFRGRVALAGDDFAAARHAMELPQAARRTRPCAARRRQQRDRCFRRSAR